MAMQDCFSLGSTVEVTTCYDEKIQGQVMAFDLNTKVLILKTNSELNAKNNDVFFVNLLFCKDINVKKENVNGAENYNQEPQSINLQRISNRVRNKVEQKKRLVSALKANVSDEARNLFMSLAKTLTFEQVAWNGPDIVVFNDVYIRPPYKPESVEVTTHGKQRELEYVRKLVLNRQEQNSNSSSSNSGTLVSSSSSGGV
ncbi:CLUMA_CG001162, isoform A [Clunio marinus]|uniref:CLUMA_CG001162, isoform A n=1 Tax=Clunio marinus TaxID=568069 RepID=A0A1J1HH62_9DIPT|nr:CLUMA_CG001162, isoform A [Clunio marinus]